MQTDYLDCRDQVAWQDEGDIKMEEYEDLLDEMDAHNAPSEPW